MDLGLQNRKALVLRASRGLGAAVARALALEGVEVHAAARNRDAIVEWAATLPQSAGRVIPHADRHVGNRQRRHGHSSAPGNGRRRHSRQQHGSPAPAPALEARRSDWLRQFETIAANIFHLTGALLPPMQLRGSGRVISIASSGVEQPIPRLALSNGIRSALIGWSKTLATEVAKNGVTVNVVLPGRIHTKRSDDLDASAAQRAGRDVSEIVAEFAASITMGRYGRPEEFADAVVFLASARASYVTGTKLRVDGGATRSI